MGRKQLYIIIALSICSAILLYKFVETLDQRRDFEHSIDAAYKQQLNHALESFSMQVNEYTYRSMISSVYSVAKMAELTSYEKVNDDLDISLHNLYISLREDKSKEKVLARTEELHEIFFMMLQDPTSKEATNRLIRIADETFFKVPD
jgi:hypothetical protein